MEENFKCPICLKVLDWSCKENIWNHLFYRHKMNNYQYLCYLCGRKCADHSSHAVHMKTHPEIRDPYKCIYCGQRFKSMDETKTHTKWHFDQSRYFDCRICGIHVVCEKFQNHVQSHVKKFQEQQQKFKQVRKKTKCSKENKKVDTIQENRSSLSKLDGDMKDLPLTLGKVEKMEDMNMNVLIYNSKNSLKYNDMQHDYDSLLEDGFSTIYNTKKSTRETSGIGSSSSCNPENHYDQNRTKSKSMNSRSSLQSTDSANLSPDLKNSNTAVVYEFNLTCDNVVVVENSSNECQLEWVLDITE